VACALAARGVDIVRADLSSLDETVQAFSGAWGIYGLTSFYEHRYDVEQLHGKHIVEAAKVVGAKHFVWSTVKGREGECRAISWKSKALIEDRIVESGIPYTFVHIPMYYENFWTSFFAPNYHGSPGQLASYPMSQYSPIVSLTMALGLCLPSENLKNTMVSLLSSVGLVAQLENMPAGKRIRIVVDYISLRDIVYQFSEVTGEKASLDPEFTEEQFEASRYADHLAAELMYLSWEFVARAGPESGVRVCYPLRIGSMVGN